MTTKWPMVPLGDVTTVLTDGDWIESKDQSPSGIRLLQTGNVGLGQYRSNENRARYISAETFERLNCTEVVAGDVLISRLPDPIGRACVIPELNERMITAVDCAVLRFIDLVLPEFFVYYSQSSEYLQTVEAKATGTTRQRISRSNLSQISVPLPPLDEQKRIVAKLDEAQQQFDRLNNNLEQQLSQLTDFDSAMLSEMLENMSQTPEHPVTSKWPKVPLGSLFKTSSGATPLKSRKDFYQDGDIPWLLSGEVSQGSINTARNFITEKALAETAAKLFPVNSVLVAMYGATAGQVGLLGFESATNQAVCAIYPSPIYFPRFVYYALLSMKEMLVSQAAGNAQPNVSQAKIKDLPFPIVSLDEQKCVVTKLDGASAQSTLLRSNIIGREKSASELQSSILAAAFTGAL